MLSDALPTQKEWENLVNWLVAQNSDQLASYILDIYKNVFFGKVSEKMRIQIFYMAERVRRAKGDESQIKSFKTYTESFFEAVGYQI